MAILILPPPPNDVLGIVMDLLPLVAPDADSDAVNQSVILVQILVLLCERAKLNSTAEKIFAAVFQSLIQSEVSSAVLH